MVYTSVGDLNKKTPISGALNIEFDFPVGFMGNPAGNATLRIWGVNRNDISQAFLLEGNTILVYGGMMKGLPLANAKLAGLLLSGFVYQAWGNWQDTVQTLDMVITPYNTPSIANALPPPAPTTKAAPAPTPVAKSATTKSTTGTRWSENPVLTFNWNYPKTQNFSTALMRVIRGFLAQDTPAKFEVSIDPTLDTMAADVVFTGKIVGDKGLDDLLAKVNDVSKAALGDPPNYPGVSVSFARFASEGVVVITDGSQPQQAQPKPQTAPATVMPGVTVLPEQTATAPKKINFVDIIGQPTWLSYGTISVKFVMRADLALMDNIYFPFTPQVGITPQAAISQDTKNKLVFEGGYRVNSLRHLGGFKSPDANSWVTVVEALKV